LLRPGFPTLLFVSIAVGALASGCGGGQGSVQGHPVVPSESASILAWNPPASYTDNTVLDPCRDLDHYEIYVRQDSSFTEKDLPVALIAAIVDASSSGESPGGKRQETEFLLENLQPFIPKANRLYVSLKAVGIDGQKSDFMTPVPWDQNN
jgi:hypothetical protein